MTASPLHRVMGTEVEYGISVPGDPGANPMVTSSQIVNAYGAPRGGAARWDYEEESPLRDARGYDLSAPNGGGGFFGGEDELGLANHILTNGARLYVDHAHPEFSSPEVTTPLDAVIWDKAGERIMAEAARRVAAIPGLPPIQLYKNNTDNKGASYGAHENYLMPRSTPFTDIVTHLVPFFVSRQVMCGAGRVGIGQDGRGVGFQISSRSDFFEVEVGLETTLKRPIINTRDEPHADAEKHRRLHVIIGDANLAELSTFLKLGTTSLVLAMIENNVLAGDLAVASPVAALRAVSHDPSLKYRIALRNGKSLTAVQLQLEYLDQARKYVEDRFGSDVDAMTARVLEKWEWVLGQLEDDPMSLASDLDWPAKLRLLQGFRDRDGLEWNAPRLALVDLQYSDVRPEKGLYNKLVARGSMNTLVTEEQVQAAISAPPEDTRAYFRGQCVSRYADQLAAASWDSVVFDLGRPSLVRVPTLDPERGTRAHVEGLLARSPDAASLVDALRGNG